MINAEYFISFSPGRAWGDPQGDSFTLLPHSNRILLFYADRCHA